RCEQIDAAVHERDHVVARPGPPVPIALGRLVAGEGKRRALVDQDDPGDAAAHRQVIRGRNPGDAGAADHDFRGGGTHSAEGSAVEAADALSQYVLGARRLSCEDRVVLTTRGDPYAHGCRRIIGLLPDRLDRQLACRAQRNRVDGVLPEARRDGFAVQGPDAALLRLARIVGQLPESCPELAFERGRRSFGGVALWDLALAIQHLALGRTTAVAEDSPEQQERLALERVASGHEVVLELDHERVDVDLVALQRQLARLADRVALRVELGEADACTRVPLGAGSLVEHYESGASLGVTQEPHGRLEGLIARGQLADLRVSLSELTLD